ncbi:MAG: hypothetical protein K6E98_12030 [Lachnospiraceae bacterium]|nr:hypothetical protein [Lachnospiraceae bacterium]
MPELINDDLINNVSGGAGTSGISKENILKEIREIEERIRTESNPTILMKLQAELKRLKMLYDHMR